MKLFARVLRYLAAIVVLVMVSGAAYQWLATAQDAKRFPMPGERIDIGGRALHLYCSGQGPVTVLLENGLGGNYAAWRLVQDDIAEFARVCNYDRAWLGWSDRSDRPTQAQFVSDDLHALMNSAGLKPPFVLVGWSAGGVFVRRYYHDHPDGVIGMVFVDSSHEQQRHRLEEPGNTEKHRREVGAQLAACRAFAWTGVVRASGVMKQMAAPLHMPADLEAEMVAMENRADYCGGIAHEMQGFEADISQADPPASLGDLPLVVLARGRASSAKDFPTPVSQAELDQVDQRWSTLQSELAALSTRSSHRIVKESGHAIPIQGPAAVVEAVRELIDRRI
ncbi:MAG TPA: alpha/beta hydrolase [Pseudomonadales bacterium]|jgi:pimeloyl-ACP methyl ester carboxylesterase|nr:alpha/beta hydrolase [Pseudomonadales bacterium]